MELHRLGCDTPKSWKQVKLDGKKVLKCRSCSLCQKLAKLCANAKCATPMRIVEDDGMSEQEKLRLGSAYKAPKPKLANAFPAELEEFELPRARHSPLAPSPPRPLAPSPRRQ